MRVINLLEIRIMGKRENKVEKYLDDEVTALGGLTRKWVSPGRDGVPDRIVRLHRWSPGIVHFVEVKTNDGELSPAQLREHKRLIDAGLLVFTVYGHEGVDEYIRKINPPVVFY